MDIGLIRKIRNILKDNDSFAGNPVNVEVIHQAEAELSVSFDNDYIEFLKLFGGSFVGFPIHGFNNCEMLSQSTVVDLTNDFRNTYSVDGRCPTINDSYVIAISGVGDPIMLNQTGEVIEYYHDGDKQKIIASSFKELIIENLLT